MLLIALTFRQGSKSCPILVSSDTSKNWVQGQLEQSFGNGDPTLQYCFGKHTFNIGLDELWKGVSGAIEAEDPKGLQMRLGGACKLTSEGPEIEIHVPKTKPARAAAAVHEHSPAAANQKKTEQVPILPPCFLACTRCSSRLSQGALVIFHLPSGASKGLAGHEGAH